MCDDWVCEGMKHIKHTHTPTPTPTPTATPTPTPPPTHPHPHPTPPSSFGFPLAVVSINATKWAMDVIRSGALNRLAIRHRSMERAAALFQAGAVYTFVDKWRRGRFTMAQARGGVGL